LGFSPNGKLLASGSHDQSAVIWNVPDLIQGDRPKVANLTAKELEERWSDLAGADALRAYQAILALAAVPEQSVPFLREHVKPRPAPDPEVIAKWIADLDSEEFAVREKATRELEKLAEAADTALRKALNHPSPEVRRRVEQLVQRLDE